MQTLRFIPAALAALALASGCAAGTAAVDATGPAVLKGKVVFERMPVEGARVALYTDGDAPLRAEPAVTAGPTDDRGEFRVDLPAGRYHAVAKADENSALRFYAYHGGNPLALAPGSKSYVIFNTVDVTQPVDLTVADEARLPGSGLMGVVTDALGKPVEGAYVYAYLTTEKAFRDRPYELSARTGADGFYALSVPPGHYYVLARRRRRGGFAGPVDVGDRMAYVPSNPVEVTEGAYARLPVRVTEILDPVLVAKQAAADNAAAAGGEAPADPIDPTARFLGPGTVFDRTTGADAIIAGVIRDPSGRPVEGFHATLYPTPDFLWEPDVISAETHADGRFRLVVPKPGTYYVGARDYYGRQLEPGDHYGFYRQGAPVRVERGARIDDVEITVEELRYD